MFLKKMADGILFPTLLFDAILLATSEFLGRRKYMQFRLPVTL
jgi:hypothetical protein